MASLGAYLPSPGSAVWRRDKRRDTHTESQAIRHVVIRGSDLITEPAPHVVYNVDVLTEHAHWCIGKRYSEFHELHKKLVREYRIHRDLLPPKKMSGNFTQQLIDSRRQLLEQYLQRLINSEPHISQSKELLVFLDQPSHDVVRVTNILAHQLLATGDHLIEQGTPVALTTNDLYCITKRLKLPLDSQHVSDQSDHTGIDLGQLYSFLHQLRSLKVVLPLPPSSVTRMTFEMTPFRSLNTLKLDHVAVSQVVGLVRIQQQLTHLSAQHCLKSIKELLIESVEERRSAMDTTGTVESWRLVAMAKFTSNRVVVQPWHNLVSLNISHNKLRYLDDSLQVLPALRELNASHNSLMKIDLQHLSLPSLQRVNLSHNKISYILSNSLVLESVLSLNIAHNMISDLGFLTSFITLHSLNLSSNQVDSREELNHLLHLKMLETLGVKSNPITAYSASRLLLLAKFIHKARDVAIDGLAATHKEQAKIHTMRQKYGDNPDLWPIAKSVIPVYSPHEEETQVTSPTQSPLPSPAPVQVSWSIESSNPRDNVGLPTSLPGSLPASIASLPDTHSRTHSQLSLEHPLFADVVLPPPSPKMGFDSTSILPSSREEPDGRSDASTHSPDVLQDTNDSSPLSTTTPPCTPLPSTSSLTQRGIVTPEMITSALDALTQAASQASSVVGTPQEERLLPELISQTLSTWISDHSTPLCTTPPPTPLDEEETNQGQGLSISDLISALTLAVSTHKTDEGGGGGGGGGSGAPSVPSSTPQEGLLELAKLGIQPEDILEALSALSIVREEEEEEKEEEEEEEEKEEEEASRSDRDERVTVHADETLVVESHQVASSSQQDEQDDVLVDKEQGDLQQLQQEEKEEEKEEEDCSSGSPLIPDTLSTTQSENIAESVSEST